MPITGAAFDMTAIAVRSATMSEGSGSHHHSQQESN
jgi:hypothetical protein